MESTERAMSSAEREVVPLNSMCSMKWEIPVCRGVSRREPVAIHTPTETERTCDMASVITRTPLASVVISMSRAGLLVEFMREETERLCSHCDTSRRGSANRLHWARMPQPLVGMELSDLREALGPERPGYRAKQIYEALYRGQAAEFAQISTLPAAMRADLAARHTVGLPEIARVYQSTDGTRSYLLRLGGGETVEPVLMPEGERDTICISSQVGCPVDCKFCMTALLGLERNLTAGEIVGQVLLVARENQLRQDGGRLNIVMMGQGEPLLNLENVTKATRILLDPAGFGLSPRRITVSPGGIVPKIDEWGREPVRPRLAISLNASTEESRRQLMPITRKYHLKDLMEACRRYPLRPWEKLTFEYVLLKNVNDSDADARRVVRLLARLNCKVNLIALNPDRK